MRRLHYAWVVAAVGFVTLITAAGFRSTPSVLIVPLQDEFGWSRATIGFAISVNLIFFGLGGPFAAGFVERFGMRRVTVGALLGVRAGVEPDGVDARAVAARHPLGRRQRPRAPARSRSRSRR